MPGAKRSTGVLLLAVVLGCSSDDAEKNAGGASGGTAGASVGGSAGNPGSGGGSNGGTTGAGGTSSVGGTSAGGAGGAALECMQASWLCACAPGETQSCDCGGFTGTRQCNSSGTAFLACDCSGGGGQGGEAGSSAIDEDCCVSHPTAGCNDPIVADCVCAFDEICCTEAWDETCVSLVDELECGGSSCEFGGVGGSSAAGGSAGMAAGGSTAAGGFGAGGTSSAGAGGGGTDDPTFGAPCLDDFDCEPDFQCVSANSGFWNGASPPNGICTVSCNGDPAACDRFAPGSICVDFGGLHPMSQICIRSCSFGPGGTTTFDPNKCNGRPDSACSPLSGGASGCVPVCSTDADCNGGFCHGDGYCRPQPLFGDPIGSSCNVADPSCSGTCQTFPNGASTLDACTAQCTLGDPYGCGWASFPTTPAPAICAFIPSENSSPGAGDLGLCAQTCDCDAECDNPSFACIVFPNPTVAASVGKRGTCGPPLDPDSMPNPNLPSCP